MHFYTVYNIGSTIKSTMSAREFSSNSHNDIYAFVIINNEAFYKNIRIDSAKTEYKNKYDKDIESCIAGVVYKSHRPSVVIESIFTNQNYDLPEKPVVKYTAFKDSIELISQLITNLKNLNNISFDDTSEQYINVKKSIPILKDKFILEYNTILNLLNKFKNNNDARNIKAKYKIIITSFDPLLEKIKTYVNNKEKDRRNSELTRIHKFINKNLSITINSIISSVKVLYDLFKTQNAKNMKKNEKSIVNTNYDNIIQVINQQPELSGARILVQLEAPFIGKTLMVTAKKRTKI